MKKRILCTLLSAAMLLTSSPVVFAAETQPVKEQQTKETLPFTITEVNNDIKDENVKGWHVQITDTVNANGVVTMKKGSGGKKVTITAKAADGSGKKKSVTIKIR